MKKQTFSFTGSIHCLEPLTVSLKDSVQGDKGHRLPRNGPVLDSIVPYFPASSIRGALRHCSHKYVLRCTKKQTGKDHPFSLDDHFMLAQGVDSGRRVKSEKGTGVTDLNEGLRKENPMLSLFGRWGLESKLSVGHAFPESHDTCWGMFGGGSRSIMFERDTELLSEITTSDTDRLENILMEQSVAAADVSEIKKEIASLKKSMRGVSKSEREDINKQIASLEEKIKLRKQEKEGPEETIRRVLDQFEAFSAGAVLTHRMALRGVSLAELGLFLLTLREFARDPQLGGHKAHNCGRISTHWTVTTWPEDSDHPVELGAIEINESGFSVNGDILKKSILEFEKNLSGFNFKRAV